jgi:predicted phosphohydrolase
MSIFAISDLHLSLSANKPMDRFGDAWIDHPSKIAERWSRSVRQTDTVLVCGDTSWAVRLEDARPDLQFVAQLPGHKILLRGNHDYWWSSLKQVRGVLSDDTRLLQNDCIEVEGWRICGSRGWSLPTPESSPDDLRIFERELARLRMSLDAARGRGPLLAMLHYPPYVVESGTSPVVQLLEEYGVRRCVYGHLHAMEPGTYPQGEHRGIEYHCVSVDLVDFTPRLVVE